MVPESLPMETEDPTLPHLVWDDDVEYDEEEDSNDAPQDTNKEDQIGGAKLNIGHEDPAVRQRLKELLKKNEHLFAPTDADLCLLYTSPSPRDRQKSRMPSSA